MNVKKAIKKISALSIGASLLGASILGASAATDLSNYPAMFIKDGVFDGAIIVGTNAVAADTLGAVDIATGLQSGGDLSSDDVEISDGAKIEKSGNRLNINETIGDVESSLDDSDLPVILADETFDENEGNNDNEEDYTQEILFDAGGERGILVLDQDDDDAPEGKLYLKFGKGSDDVMYNYTLEFDDKVDYDNTSSTNANEDFETATIKIQGNVYTIVKAKTTSAGKLDELKLQAGDTTVWLEQDTPITKVVNGEEHEIELVDVNENEDKCGIMVDGQLKWIDTSSSEEVSGIEVGVTDAIIVHSEKEDTDVCEVNLGATEVILSNGNEVEINGKEIDGSEVEFVENTAGELEEINIWYTPQDDIYLSEGDSYTDPVLGNFEFTFANIEADYEEIKLDVSGDDMTLNFNNEDGKEIKIPFYCNDSCDTLGNETADAIIVGTSEDVDDRYYFKGGSCVGTSSVTDCEGARFIVTQGDEVHVIEVDDIDLNNNETTLKDVTYGGTKTTHDLIDSSAENFELPAGGSYAVLTINPGSNSVTFTGGAGDEILGVGDQMKTENELLLKITGIDNNGVIITNASASASVGSLVIHFNESEGEVDDTTDTVVSGDNGDSRGEENNFTITIDTSDEELNIGNPDLQYASQRNVDKDENDDDTQIYYTDFGTKIVHDDDEKRSATIYFSNDELYADVFVSPIGANVIIGSDGGQVDVGTARLASEVSDINAQNVIIVGGPCANEAAAEFLGVSASNCMDGAPDANTAVIKLKESDEGKVAMLVNGYSAIDTRRAARVLGKYSNYDLSGTEVVVTGTDFTDITVQKASEYESEKEVTVEEEETTTTEESTNSTTE